MITPVQKEKFWDLACRLSPENLNLDGEISPAEARRRYAAIMREWHALERECGEKVTEEMVYDLMMDC